MKKNLSYIDSVHRDGTIWNLSVMVLLMAYVGYFLHAVLVYSTTVKAFAGISPAAFFKGMAPALMMAFSSASSVGTLPLTMECSQKLGARREVASFVLPLGATINMDGAAITITIMTLAAANTMGIHVDFGTALLLVIPTSVWVSDQINAIYTKSIEITVQSANAVSDNLIGDMTDKNQENTTVIDEAKEILGDLSGSVAEVIKQFKNVLNRFVEATAVMIVTTCLVPLLVILFFAWMMKTLFHIPITLRVPQPKQKKKVLLPEAEET